MSHLPHSAGSLECHPRWAYMDSLSSWSQIGTNETTSGYTVESQNPVLVGSFVLEILNLVSAAHQNKSYHGNIVRVTSSERHIHAGSTPTEMKPTLQSHPTPSELRKIIAHLSHHYSRSSTTAPRSLSYMDTVAAARLPCESTASRA